MCVVVKSVSQIFSYTHMDDDVPCPVDAPPTSLDRTDDIYRQAKLSTNNKELMLTLAPV